MPTAIGKKLRSRKVQLACEKRQLQLSDKQNYQSYRDQELNLMQQNEQTHLAQINGILTKTTPQ